LDKNKINIDQFFKTKLQNFEGSADESMFEAIKKKVDASKADAAKLSVDDYFKKAMLGFEVNADDVSFDAIKSKVDASKVSIDSYFKEALLDFNADALFLPFSEIQSKIDPEKVIDEHFKEALKNYEGLARDEEFAVIRERVLKIQRRENRKRYTLLLLLLLIPAFFGVQKYFRSQSNATPSNIAKSDIILPPTHDQLKTPDNSNSTASLNGSKGTNNVILSNNIDKAGENHIVNPNTVRHNGAQNNHDKTQNNILQNGGNATTNKNNGEEGTPGNKTAIGKDNNNINNTVLKNEDENKEVLNGERKTSTDEIKTPNAKPTEPGVATNPLNTNNTNIRKPQPKFTLAISGAATYNSRYLNTRDSGSKYLATRNQSDNATIKNNFGLDLFQQMGKLSFGIGLHENQFGQMGSYHIFTHIYDSVPVYDSAWVLKGYLRYIKGDTAYLFNYNNAFTSIEIPLQASFKIWSSPRWEYEIGAGALLSYITNAKGALPTMNADGVVQLKNNMNTIHRFGAGLTVTQRLNYNITTHWQLGTEIYIKTNVTSLYKNNTGIMEYPYSFGWRWGIGFKF
jgi:hypothetical protein